MVFELRATDVDERFSIAECPACGVRRTLPVPDDLRSYYETELARSMISAPGPIFAWLRRMLLRLEVRRLLASDEQTYLDVGCGAGAVALALHQRGLRVRAADAWAARPPLLAGAPAVVYHRLDFDRHEISGLPSGDRYTVILRHVLEHLKDPSAFLRRLQDYGARRFYVVVPNSGALERRLLGSYWYLWDPPRHLWHFDAESLRALCDRVGLEVRALGHDTIPNLLPSVYRLLRLRGFGAAVCAPFGPKSALTALSAPLNFLLPGNVVWLLAEDTQRARPCRRLPCTRG